MLRIKCLWGKQNARAKARLMEAAAAEAESAARPARRAPTPQELGLQVKSYYGESIPAAMAIAAKELGPDAMLITSRATPPEFRAHGAFEVVFGIAAEEAPAPVERNLPRRPIETFELKPLEGEPAPAPAAAIPAEPIELRPEPKPQLETPFLGIKRPRPVRFAQFDRFFAHLTSVGLDGDLVWEILSEVRAAADGSANLSDAEATRILTSRLLSRVRFEPALGPHKPGPNFVAFVGPPGAGKTAAVAKAAALAIRQGRTPILLGVGNEPTGHQHLKSLAAALQVEAYIADKRAIVWQAIERRHKGTLVLVDTAGYVPSDVDSMAPLARFLGSQPQVDVHLVLPATAHPSSMKRAVERCEIFAPAKLLFTMLDESGEFGAAYGEAARTGKPVSFLAAGREVGNGLEAATPQRLVELLRVANPEMAVGAGR